ncbi:MAG TPA: PTS sugar transporter subunit IIA [Pseudomonadales bacterium]|nr:PTS sugar transporter subunit IIA [Pseudomonadales bacterium]
MELAQILSPECTRHDLVATSKKRALELASEVLAEKFPELDAGEVFDALMARERLGSTAVGEGVAIPHCRTEGCHDPVAALLRLHEPVDFEAPDGAPVDLLFVLVVPAQENETHLEWLAAAARALNDPDFRGALRATDSDPGMFECARTRTDDSARRAV